jgi:hypothetical protein
LLSPVVVAVTWPLLPWVSLLLPSLWLPVRPAVPVASGPAVVGMSSVTLAGGEAGGAGW